jgi:hypothetical protein
MPASFASSAAGAPTGTGWNPPVRATAALKRFTQRAASVSDRSLDTVRSLTVAAR